MYVCSYVLLDNNNCRYKYKIRNALCKFKLYT